MVDPEPVLPHSGNFCKDRIAAYMHIRQMIVRQNLTGCVCSKRGRPRPWLVDDLMCPITLTKGPIFYKDDSLYKTLTCARCINRG